MLKQTWICSLCCNHWFIVLSSPFYCFHKPDSLLWHLCKETMQMFFFVLLTLLCGFEDDSRPLFFFPPTQTFFFLIGDLKYSFQTSVDTPVYLWLSMCVNLENRQDLSRVMSVSGSCALLRLWLIDTHKPECKRLQASHVPSLSSQFLLHCQSVAFLYFNM